MDTSSALYKLHQMPGEFAFNNDLSALQAACGADLTWIMQLPIIEINSEDDHYFASSHAC
jgi:hypothetical protein